MPYKLLQIKQNSIINYISNKKVIVLIEKIVKGLFNNLSKTWIIFTYLQALKLFYQRNLRPIYKQFLFY